MRDHEQMMLVNSGKSSWRRKSLILKPTFRRGTGPAGLYSKNNYISRNKIKLYLTARSSLGIKRTVRIVNNQDECEKYATDKKKDIKIMRLRNNATFGTWNVRTLNRTGNLEELDNEMKKYTWQVL